MSIPTGTAAELLAARHLEEQGYRILARNVRSKLGELDLVARDSGILCFVEVRLRRRGRAEESIDRAKRRRLERAAQQYLSSRRLHDEPCRFDVVGVALDGERPSFTLIRNAF